SEGRHRSVQDNEGPGRTTKAREGVPTVVLVELCSGLGNRYRIYGELFLILMEGKLKAIGQQLLNHHLQLIDIRYPFCVGFAGDIVLFRFEPGWSASDLPRMYVVGKFDQIT